MKLSPDRLLELAATGQDPQRLLAELPEDDDTQLAKLAAVPRWLDEGVMAALLEPGADAKQALARLDELRLTERAPGADDAVRMRRGPREEHLQRWWRDRGAGSTVPQEFVDVSARLERHLAGRGEEIESLYHGLAVHPEEAAPRLGELFDEAEHAFDLTRCHEIVDALTEAANHVPSSVVDRADRLSARLARRSSWIDDRHRSARFLTPAGSVEALERLASGEQRRLELRARGGMGKTMHLRWLVARGCVPKGVACARLDFDEASAAAAIQSPWLVLLGIAEQLAPQIPGGPFDALIRQYGDQLPRLYPSAGAEAPLPLSLDQDRDIGDRVEESFSSCMAAIPAEQRWLIILDTLELPLLRLPPDGSAPLEFLNLLAPLRDLPSGGIVFAGRNAVEERAANFAASFPDTPVLTLVGLTPDERARYLREKRGVRDDELIEAAAAVAGEVPLKLALVADVIDRKPGIKPDELRSYGEPSLLYLVERVLDRVDERTRWALRYGAVPRTLDVTFLAEVARPYLAQAMSGDYSRDAVPKQTLPDGRPAGALFQGDLVARGDEVDVTTLWTALRRYAGDSSWVWIPAGRADTLVLHGDVVEPMRRWLAEQDDLFHGLQRDAVGYFERLEREDPAHAAEYGREAVFHTFQLEGPDAVEYWRRRLRAAAGPLGAQLRLTLADDLVGAPEYFNEDGPVKWRDGRPLVDEATRDEARFEAAWAHIQIARSNRQPPTSRHWREARDLLRSAQAGFADPRGQGVTAARLAMARGALSVAAGNEEDAKEQFKIARRGLRAVEDLLWIWLEYGTLVTSGPLRALRESRVFTHALARASGESRYWRRRFEELAASRDEADGQLDRALQHLEASAELAEGDEQENAQAAVARLRLRTGENGAALRLVGEPKTPTARLVRAWALVRRLEADKALDELERVLDQLSPEIRAGDQAATRLAAEAEELRGRAFTALLDADGATSAFLKAAGLRSLAGDLEGVARAHVRRASFLLQTLGDVRGAELALEAAAKTGAVRGGSAWTKGTLLAAHVADRRLDHDRAAAAVDEALEGLDAASPPPRVLVNAALTAIVIGAPKERNRYAERLLEQLDRVKPEGARLQLVARLRRARSLEGISRGKLSKLRKLVPAVSDADFRDLDDRDRAMLLLADAELDRLLGRRDDAREKLLAARSELVADTAGGAALRAWLETVGRLGGEPDLVAGLRHRIERWIADPNAPASVRGALAISLGRATGEQLDPELEALLAETAHQVAVTRGSGPWEAGIAAVLAGSARARGDLERAQRHADRARRIYQQLGDLQSRDRLRSEMSEPVELASPAADDVVDVALRQLRYQFSVEARAGRSAPTRDMWPDPDLADMLSASRSQGWGAAYARALVRALVDHPDELAHAMFRLLASSPLVESALDGGDARDLRIRLLTPALEGAPWELAAPKDGPRLLDRPGLGTVYRGFAAPTVDVIELRAIQLGLKTAGFEVSEDGTLGPQTRVALRAFQEREGLAVTGSSDPVTVQRLQALLCPTRAVTVVRPGHGRTQAKGSWYTAPVDRLYASHGFHVQPVEAVELDHAMATLRSRPTMIVHISAPLIETGGSIALDFGIDPSSSSATRGAQAVWLTAPSLDQAFQGPLPAPILILDPPRPPSDVDTAAQLVLRNAFAGELFALGNTRAIFGVGLVPPHSHDEQAAALLEPLAEGATFGETITRLRRSSPASAGATLHARGADLLPPWW